jgi:molybdopterin molybdotransferase
MGSATCSRAPISEAAAWTDASVAPMPPEDVPLAEATGRVLAVAAAAPMDLPTVNCAAVDGFALRAEETIGSGAYNPLPFRLARADGSVSPGMAVAVEIGDPLPAGADAVARLEHATPDGPETIAIIAPVAAGSEVERAGSRAARGDILVAPGRRLGPGEIGLLASVGTDRVTVVGRPRVRCLLAAGRATVVGEATPPRDIHDANGPMLAALISRDGGVVVEQRRIAPSRAAVRDAIGSAGADVVIVAGGTGPGPSDEAAAALAEAGELAFHGIALRPGETAGAGRVSGIPVFLLPGAPVACLWTYELLAGRAVRKAAGRSPEAPFATRGMRLVRKIVSEAGMTDVCPVRLAGEDEAEALAPFAEAGLVVAAQAHGFVIVPEATEGYPQGATVTVHLYPGRSEAPCAADAIQHEAGRRGV